MTTAPMHEWGRRLSDAVRAALDAGDLRAARRLALEGDGQARSLAKEFALMYRGLGITVRVLLGLLADTASAEVAGLVRRFRLDMAQLTGLDDGGGPAPADPGGGLDEEVRRAAKCLEAGEERFDQEQARFAEEVVLAIDAGDIPRARACLDVKERGHYVPRHDRLIRFMAESFGLVLSRSGPAALLHLHMATAEGQRRGFERWEQMSTEEFAWTSAYLMKQHMGRLEVTEDAEKFTIRQSLCGSGGALVLRGAYAGPEALPYVEGPARSRRVSRACPCTAVTARSGTASRRCAGSAVPTGSSSGRRVPMGRARCTSTSAAMARPQRTSAPSRRRGTAACDLGHNAGHRFGVFRVTCPVVRRTDARSEF